MLFRGISLDIYHQPSTTLPTSITISHVYILHPDMERRGGEIDGEIERESEREKERERERDRVR